MTSKTHLKRLQEKLAAFGAPALLITSEAHQAWVSDFEFTDGYVLVTEKNAYVITDFRYLEAAKATLSSDFEASAPASMYAEIKGILKNEGVGIDSVIAHGGYYKTPFVGQNATSALLGAPVTVMQNASEGGAFGMALLALYMKKREGTLPEFLEKIFSKVERSVVTASTKEREKCRRFLAAYRKGIAVEHLASKTI